MKRFNLVQNIILIYATGFAGYLAFSFYLCVVKIIKNKFKKPVNGEYSNDVIKDADSERDKG